MRLSLIKLAAIISGLAPVVLMCGRMVRPANAQQAPVAQSFRTPEKADQQTQLLLMESQEEADQKSAGCKSCHTKSDSATMHSSPAVRLGCTDCHGGNEKIFAPPQSSPQSPDYIAAKKQAHPQPHVLSNSLGGALPVRAYTAWLREDPTYIRFVNPGDLRIASRTCGRSGCHFAELQKVRTSMMSHGAMLWGAALYNNGAFPLKNPHFGESYAENGEPQRLVSVPPPTPDETKNKGVLPSLEPLERWEISQPGNVLRVFERGGTEKAEIGNPVLDEDPGKPDVKLSDRGFGTKLRTDPVFLGLQKTRLLDPLLYMPGTNDQPGDYRNSGCSACHVVFANDRSPVHSGPYAQYGHSGFSATVDPTVPKEQSGHPIMHKFTRGIPSSQCMVCHMHPGTNMVTTYFGFTWWDNEVDGEKMYPTKQHNPTPQEQQTVAVRNPEGATPRGLWAGVPFLSNTGSPDFLSTLKSTQFADFHGHGWNYRAVYKRNLQGEMLDKDGRPISPDDPDKFKKAVHLQDIHLEKGMHCVDCHFAQDNHGNGRLYGETRNAVEVDCIDCHGSIEARTNLKTSGPAAPVGGTNLELLRTPFGDRRFYWNEDRLYQRSMLEQNKQWEVKQVLDSISPGSPNYNEKAHFAKTVRHDGMSWGTTDDDDSNPLAHSNKSMTCYSCHSAWIPTCFGCHLEMAANRKMPMLHNEGITTRNWTSYSFQILRDDIYMLGIDGTVTGHRVAPVRSACAVLVSSQNSDRDWLYYQQQTVSAEGFSGQAFSPFVPHTVRTKETKTCSDCHVSTKQDNNAWLAHVLIQGTGFMNFMGRYIYVANGKEGYHAVAVAEHTEPPAILGSDFQKVAYPANYEQHLKNNSELKEAYHHDGTVLDLQARGEYLYTATGTGGVRVFDIANLDDKDFSERMTTAPVSPLGQKFYLKTKYAQSVASPTTLGVDPLRSQNPENEEQPMLLSHLFYGFLYVADKYEGLVIVGDPNLKDKSPGVGTLLDGNPSNNFLKRALAFNPDGALNGARRIGFVGTYAYILCDRGLVVVDLYNPLEPKIVSRIGAPYLLEPRAIGVQFRYAFVVDSAGMKVLDITDPSHPVPVQGAWVPLSDARNIYIARTYAYIADGKDGIAIVNVEAPQRPQLEQMFNAGGKLNDTNDVKIGMVSSSQFAFVADGHNGLQVVQLFSPQTTPYFYGFAPKPVPKLIASYKTKEPALAISRGIDRDRAVDETGNQLTVFGRRGSRPFNYEEMKRLYMRNGQLFTVTNDPPGPAMEPLKQESAAESQRPESRPEVATGQQNNSR
jgi:hypothetical protein